MQSFVELLSSRYVYFGLGLKIKSILIEFNETFIQSPALKMLLPGWEALSECVTKSLGRRLTDVCELQMTLWTIAG